MSTEEVSPPSDVVTIGTLDAPAVIEIDAIPSLPGEVSSKRAPRKPTAKQLEALEANRKKRQAEAVARKAVKIAEKAATVAASATAKKDEAEANAQKTAAVTASIVASIPPSQAATARKRSADIAELPIQLRRMEAKFEARMQTILDSMHKMATVRAASTAPQRYFPRVPVPVAVQRLSDPSRQRSRILSRVVTIPEFSDEEEDTVIADADIDEAGDSVPIEAASGSRRSVL